MDVATTPVRVFLCSTFVDLLAERKSVLDAVRRLQLQHDSMEFFGARDKLPIKTCLEEVRKSDVLVIIIGHRYGNLVPRRQVSFSEAEYREGRRQRKPCLVYIRDENVPVKPGHIESDPEKTRLLTKWKRVLAKRHTLCTFRDSTDLAIQVTVDLSRLLRVMEIKPQTSNQQDPEKRRVELENKAYVTNLEALVGARTEQLRQTIAEVERAYDCTLEAFVDALDLKEAETEGHSKRVTAFTIAITRAMGLSREKVRGIARGAFLHDIGKMAIPDALLRKPGTLTEAETAIMREHCLRGYQMLKKFPFLSDAAEIVYSHHERYDGSGYPRGLKGEQIVLGSRIFAIADTLDAITSNHPYRAAQPLSVARKEITSHADTQFDPAIVKVFLNMPENIFADLRKEIS